MMKKERMDNRTPASKTTSQLSYIYSNTTTGCDWEKEKIQENILIHGDKSFLSENVSFFPTKYNKHLELMSP